jgi:hypothetical protein
MTQKRAGIGVCVAALLWSGLLLLVHVFFGGIACGFDTSNCARSRDKDTIYQGVLTDPQGHTYTGAFTVRFASRQNSREVGGFSTDPQGHYCVAWASERVVPFALIDGTEAPLRMLDKPGAPVPPGCQQGDAGVPWNRSDALSSSPQYLALLFTTLIGGIVLMGALAFGRERPGRALRRTGLALTVVSTLLFAVLWF